MLSSTAESSTCNWCGRPMINFITIGGLSYHPECCHGPSFVAHQNQTVQFVPFSPSPAEKALDTLIDAWEVLPEGDYPPAMIEKWLAGPMKRAIGNARKLRRKE